MSCQTLNLSLPGQVRGSLSTSTISGESISFFLFLPSHPHPIVMTTNDTLGRAPLSYHDGLASQQVRICAQKSQKWHRLLVGCLSTERQVSIWRWAIHTVSHFVRLLARLCSGTMPALPTGQTQGSAPSPPRQSKQPISRTGYHIAVVNGQQRLTTGRLVG